MQTTFADVLFTNTYAGIRPAQLFRYLKNRNKPRFLLDKVPTTKLLSTKIISQYRELRCVTPIDDSSFITVQEPCVVTIWTVDAEIRVKHRIDLHGDIEKRGWEIVLVGHKAFVLAVTCIVVIDVRQGKELYKFDLTRSHRFGHPSMLFSNEHLFVTSLSMHVTAYSLQGQQKSLMAHVGSCGIFKVQAICMVDDLIAIACAYELVLYDMKNVTCIWRKETEETVISLEYFSEFGILVGGTDDGQIVLVDTVKATEITRFRSELDERCKFVKKVGCTWLAAIIHSDCVIIYDILSHQIVTKYNGSFNSIVPWSENRLITLTSDEVAVWQ
jgi:hypothetical protein